MNGSESLETRSCNARTDVVGVSQQAGEARFGAAGVAGPGRGRVAGVDHDCNDIPDAAMTLAVAALFAQGPTTIRNVYNWRVKETERMVAIVTECRKLGAQVELHTALPRCFTCVDTVTIYNVTLLAHSSPA